MARRRRISSRKVKSVNKKFGKAVRKCHKETDSLSGFGRCMKKEMNR